MLFVETWKAEYPGNQIKRLKVVDMGKNQQLLRDICFSKSMNKKKSYNYTDGHTLYYR